MFGPFVRNWKVNSEGIRRALLGLEPNVPGSDEPDWTKVMAGPVHHEDSEVRSSLFIAGWIGLYERKPSNPGSMTSEDKADILSIIPSEADLAALEAQAKARLAKLGVDYEVRAFTFAIEGAMRAFKNFYESEIAKLSPEAEKRLKSAFADRGWTLTVRNKRTGCTISWI